MEKINIEQHELIENAQSRIKQKKRLYFHFVFFVIANIFMFIANKVLNYYEELNWHLWILLIWGFLFALHFVNVFITHTFLGKEWERKQREKLVELQKEKIATIKRTIENKSTLELKKNSDQE